LQIIIETNAEIIFELEKILKEAVRPEWDISYETALSKRENACNF
jgi:hypothetical protein